MKKIMVGVALLVTVQVVHSQNADEWLRQKKTQIKYLLNQIAANQVYIEFLQKGYKVVDGGLQTINDIKHGDFDLHDAFFRSLQAVNPRLQRWEKVAAIVHLQIRLVTECRQTIQHIRQSGQFTAEELHYCQQVMEHLFGECAGNVQELLQLLEDGQWQMKDDERMKRIDGLYTEMQDKYAFGSGFGSDLQLLALQRQAEQQEINRSRQWQGHR